MFGSLIFLAHILVSTRMKIKLDENLSRHCISLIAEAGHDAATVAAQELAGAADARLIDVCRVEDRCLLTLDLDFANPLRFPPNRYPGIAVLRLPAKPGYEDLINAVRTFLRITDGRHLRGLILKKALAIWFCFVILHAVKGKSKN